MTTAHYVIADRADIFLGAHPLRRPQEHHHRACICSNLEYLGNTNASCRVHRCDNWLAVLFAWCGLNSLLHSPPSLSDSPQRGKSHRSKTPNTTCTCEYAPRGSGACWSNRRCNGRVQGRDRSQGLLALNKQAQVIPIVKHSEQSKLRVTCRLLNRADATGLVHKSLCQRLKR
jgi:hypothetical protein